MKKVSIIIGAVVVTAFTFTAFVSVNEYLQAQKLSNKTIIQ